MALIQCRPGQSTVHGAPVTSGPTPPRTVRPQNGGGKLGSEGGGGALRMGVGVNRKRNGRISIFTQAPRRFWRTQLSVDSQASKACAPLGCKTPPVGLSLLSVDILACDVTSHHPDPHFQQHPGRTQFRSLHQGSGVVDHSRCHVSAYVYTQVCSSMHVLRSIDMYERAAVASRYQKDTRQRGMPRWSNLSPKPCES